MSVITEPDTIRPHMKVLTNAQIERLHQAALTILEQTGLSIKLPEAVALLKNAGAKVEGEDRVYLPREMVETAIKKIPKKVNLYTRNGEPAMSLTGTNCYYGPGPTIQFTYDPFTGERRPTDTEDIECMARLCDHLPNVDYVMTMGLSGGADPSKKGLNPIITDRIDFAAMVKNTCKPLIFSAWSQEGLKDIWEMAVKIKGGEKELEEKPFTILYTQPISPLVIDTEPLRQLLFCAEKHIPFVFSSAPMMGATSPNTIAACMAQSIAEFLGGLVIAQIKRPSAPSIMGVGYGPMDFKIGTSPYNGPEYYMCKVLNKEMATFYGLPDWNYGGLTDAKILDAQAASEAALSLFNATLVGSNLIHDLGYMEMGMTSCLELIVLSDEIIDSFSTYFKGVSIDDDTLALDLINKVGPGGNFLGKKHTVQNLRNIWQPKLFDRSNYDQFQSKGKVKLETKLTEKVKWILENHTPEPLDKNAAHTIDEIITRAQKRYR